MKRILSVLLVALMLLFAASCSTQEKHTSRSSRPTRATTLQSEPSTQVETEPSVPTENETTTQLPVTLADCVSVWKEQHVVYSDDVGNSYDILFSIPQINLSGEDVQEANEEIQSKCGSNLEQTLDASEKGYSAGIAGIYYEAYLNDGILTVLVHIDTQYDYNTYLLYSFDTATGEDLDNDDMAVILGCDEAALDARIRNCMVDCFETLYSDVRENAADFYDEQLARTCSEDNIDDAEVYLGEDGEPYVLARIYSLAGAEDYYHLLPLQ